MEVTNRAELVELLEVNMKRSYEDILDDTKLEPEQNIPKTYIIESNLNVKYLKNLGIQIKSLEDYRLYHIKFGEATYYLDAIDDRFWIFYSLQKSEISDKYINKLISPLKSRLDNLWLPNSILKSLLDNYTIRGVATKFIGSPVVDEESNRLSIDSLGYEAYELIKAINEISEEDLRNITNEKIKRSLKNLLKVKNYLRLSKAKIKFEDEENDEFVLEDVYYWGKFTVKGNDINKHFKIVNRVLDEYKDKLNLIESSLIDIESDNIGDKTPLLYEFKKDIEDLEAFVSYLTSLKQPFKIFGIPMKVEEDMFYISAVDLHNGDNFDLEITPWWIRMYLPKGSCGNTALRLLTNLQQTHDANTYLEVGINEEKIK
ncbi:hypothetical protein [Methanotorris igneus]|uniref:Uncharacterized protein n=1 Tax=Methanotorris igneus (strain DSM 5666 / JCM 11834 / Kol 5) TaxID=880724 RepID=F6BF69_METIK|nr:hypothetical protein [Methanotorris igneus]AEF96939.1 hypothetical protein Metig_1404 [Methanotorris igneus Kol 5]